MKIWQIISNFPEFVFLVEPTKATNLNAICRLFTIKEIKDAEQLVKVYQILFD